MKQNIKRMANLITQKKKFKLQTQTGGQFCCPHCGKQKVYGSTYKSPISGKHYCGKKCADLEDQGQKQVKRMRQLAGVKPKQGCQSGQHAWFVKR